MPAGPLSDTKGHVIGLCDASAGPGLQENWRMMDLLADLGPYTVPILALAGLIVLAGLVVWLGRLARRNRSQGVVAGHRLAVIDHIQIDENRRLVLIQRDDVQHLVVLGGGSDFLVESGIAAVHARAPQHPPVAVLGADHGRTPEPARPADALPHESPRAAEPLRAADPSPLDPHRFDPPRPAEPYRAAPLRAEPQREPRPPRDMTPPAAPRAPRPVQLPPEARAPVEPRPPMISRGPARDIGIEPALAPSAAVPVGRRPLEPRVSEIVEPARIPPQAAPSPNTPPAAAIGHRAEPIVTAPSEPEAGARVTVKVDPLFADMAEHLEEALRRPPAPEAEPVRPPGPASAVDSPAFERALERALDRPARPAPPAASAMTPAHVPIPVPVAAPAPVAAVAASMIEPAPVPIVRGPHAGAPPVNPPSGAPDESAPDIRLDAGVEPAPTPIPAAPPVRAIDMFAPEIRLPDDAGKPPRNEDEDLFEEEMASLLGRNRRP